MAFLSAPASQARQPLAEVLPDGRKRLTRFFRVNQDSSNIPAELQFVPGTPDVWPQDQTPTGWTGLYSTYVQMKDSERGFPQGGEDDKPIVQLVFEQIAITGETFVDGNDQTDLPDGRTQLVENFLQFSFNDFVPKTINVDTATADDGTVCYLFKEETDNDGTLIKITRTYQSPGIVETDLETLQGGALLTQKISTFHTVPSTPAGYTLVGTPTQNPNGYPIYTYTFAKGNGALPTVITGREDGSLMYVESALGPSAATPAYSGSGTAYLERLQQIAEDGYYHNIATYIKPQGVTLPKTMPYTVPGLATAGNPSTFDPPITRHVASTVTIAYSTTANTSTAYSVTHYAQLSENYTLTDGTPQSTIRALDGYVGSSTSSGTNTTYRGLPVLTYVVTVSGSTPTSQPSGSTILYADAEIYLTQTSGVIVYKNTTITATL